MKVFIEGLKFKLKNVAGKCLVPKTIIHQGVTVRSVGVNDTCQGRGSPSSSSLHKYYF